MGSAITTAAVVKVFLITSFSISWATHSHPGRQRSITTVVTFQTLTCRRLSSSVAFPPQEEGGPIGAAFSEFCTKPNQTYLLEDDLDTAVLRLTHAIGRLDQRLGLALADDRDRRRRHAVAHQGVLDRIRTAQRQRHVVVLRTRAIGVAGRGDPGLTRGLELVGRLPDRVQRLL